MRSPMAPCLLLILGSGCQSQDAARGEEKLHQVVESLAGCLKARDAEITTRDSKIARIETELADRKALIERLNLRLKTATSEDSAKSDRIKALQVQFDGSNTLLAKLEADMEVFVRQLEVQLAHVSQLTNKVEEHRGKLAQALNEKSVLAMDVQYARQRVTQLEKQLAEKKDK